MLCIASLRFGCVVMAGCVAQGLPQKLFQDQDSDFVCRFLTKVTMAGKHSAPKVKAKAKGKASAKDASAEPATKKARVTGKTPDANAKSMVDLNHPTRKFMEAAGFAIIT